MDPCGWSMSLECPSHNATIHNTILALIYVSKCCVCAAHALGTHLADAASLTESADCTHVALVA